MSFGIQTLDAAGNVISQFDGSYTRIANTIRVEALTTGSYVVPGISAFTFTFLIDDPVQRTPPYISVVGRTISWRPYATSPAFHAGGYLMVFTI